MELEVSVRVPPESISRSPGPWIESAVSPVSVLSTSTVMLAGMQAMSPVPGTAFDESLTRVQLPGVSQSPPLAPV